jgi:hypothetical protein
MSNRFEMLRDLAELHYKWVKANVDTDEFNPESRPESGDYNVWHVDFDPRPEIEAEFQSKAAEIIDSEDF